MNNEPFKSWNTNFYPKFYNRFFFHVQPKSSSWKWFKEFSYEPEHRKLKLFGFFNWIQSSKSQPEFSVFFGVASNFVWNGGKGLSIVDCPWKKEKASRNSAPKFRQERQKQQQKLQFRSGYFIWKWTSYSNANVIRAASPKVGGRKEKVYERRKN